MSEQKQDAIDYDLCYHITLYEAADGLFLVVLCKQHFQWNEQRQQFVPQPEFYQPMFDDWDYKTHPECNGALLVHGRDLWPHKEATDFIISGRAHAPKGAPVSRIRVGVQIGGFVKHIDVFGERYAYERRGGIAFSDPQFFESVEMEWWNAYGGLDPHWLPESLDKTPTLLGVAMVEFFPGVYPRNPQGMGYLIRESDFINEIRLPQLEDPQNLLSPDNFFAREVKDWWRRPMPQGLSWQSPRAFPRCIHIGNRPYHVPDESVWTSIPEIQIGEVRAEQLRQVVGRLSLDPRMTQESAPWMRFRDLSSDTQVKIEGMTKDKPLHFRLPFQPPEVKLINRETDARYPFATRLNTVVLDTEKQELSMLWGTQFALSEDDASLLAGDIDLDDLANRYCVTVDRVLLDRRNWPAPRLDPDDD